jgi:hypothetical protein
MDLMDRPPPPDSTRPTPASNRSTKRWALLAAVLCPCHLWLVAALIGFVGAGATAEAIRQNQGWLAIVLTPLAAFALWRAVTVGRTAAQMKRAGVTCSSPR